MASATRHHFRRPCGTGSTIGGTTAYHGVYVCGRLDFRPPASAYSRVLALTSARPAIGASGSSSTSHSPARGRSPPACRGRRSRPRRCTARASPAPPTRRFVRPSASSGGLLRTLSTRVGYLGVLAPGTLVCAGCSCAGCLACHGAAFVGVRCRRENFPSRLWGAREYSHWGYSGVLSPGSMQADLALVRY